MRRFTSVFLATLFGCAPAEPPPEARGPIIDMHQHAMAAAFWGTPDPDWFPADLPRAPSDSAVLQQTLEAMQEFNIVKAATSGTPRWVNEWVSLAPDRLLPALNFAGACTPGLIERLRELHGSSGYDVMGEISWQVTGIPFDDQERVGPCFALAEELDIPMGIHVGLLFEGVSFGGYSAGGGRPLDLEPMIIRHPDARVYLMHAGWPLLDETIALMHVHSQIYVDISLINWYLPRAAFHSYLKSLVEAGLDDRIMFGTDSGVWPGAISLAIEGVESAPFLTAEQKRDIFYNNAMRFLRLNGGQ